MNKHRIVYIENESAVCCTPLVAHGTRPKVFSLCRCPSHSFYLSFSLTANRCKSKRTIIQTLYVHHIVGRIEAKIAHKCTRTVLCSVHSFGACINAMRAYREPAHTHRDRLNAVLFTTLAHNFSCTESTEYNSFCPRFVCLFICKCKQVLCDDDEKSINIIHNHTEYTYYVFYASAVHRSYTVHTYTLTSSHSRVASKQLAPAAATKQKEQLIPCNLCTFRLNSIVQLLFHFSSRFFFLVRNSHTQPLTTYY